MQVKVYKYPKFPKQGPLPAKAEMPAIPATAESTRGRQNLPSVKKGKKKSPKRGKNEDNAVYMPEKFSMDDGDHYAASNYILNGPAGKAGLAVPGQGQKKQRNRSNMKSRKN